MFDNPVDPAGLALFLDSPSHELVFAMWEGRAIGFASGCIMFHPDKRPVFFINEVSVDENKRRNGIATELCQRLLSIARERGSHGIWLATEADNIAGRALYRGLNARETTEIVVYDWDGAMDE